MKVKFETWNRTIEEYPYAEEAVTILNSRVKSYSHFLEISKAGRIVFKNGDTSYKDCSY